MANIEEVLWELKSLRSEFGTRFDVVDQKLTDMTTTLSTLKDTVNDVKQYIASNTACIDQAKTRSDETETAQEETQTALRSAIKWISLLEAKTEHLDNQGSQKNLRILGIWEGAEGT